MPPPSSAAAAAAAAGTATADGGVEELLEIAEAILFSVPLPPTVLDKYKLIKAEVRGRSRDSPTAPPPSSSFTPSSTSTSAAPFTSSDRQLMQEKLANSKRKNASLQSQLTQLEQQVSQLTTKMAALHTHHKSSLAEVLDQTKAACEEAYARQLAEMEGRIRVENGVGRQVLDDQLAAERVFHSSVTEKMSQLSSMFPDSYASLSDLHAAAESQRTGTLNPKFNQLFAAMTGSASDSHTTGLIRNSTHPNSFSRLYLNGFFELTRQGLNEGRHALMELKDARAENKNMRIIKQVDETFKYTSEKSLEVIEKQVKELKSELSDEGVYVKQRNDIIARVNAIQDKIRPVPSAASTAAKIASPLRPAVQPQPPRSPPLTHTSSSTSPLVSSHSTSIPASAASSSSTSINPTQDSSDRRPSMRSQASVQRLEYTDEEEENTDEEEAEDEQLRSARQQYSATSSSEHEEKEESDEVAPIKKNRMKASKGLTRK